MDVLWTDCSAEDVEWAFNNIVPHSQDAFETPCQFIASDIIIPKTFVLCTKDKAFPPEKQELLVQSIPDMKCVKLDTGHSPFLGPFLNKTTKLLIDIVEGA